ncbi:SMC-Scp complex subunit ScpB [Luteimonas kalidii]|uniref:SMC-Scp complex subunit ScpB n=1 Tax=Luteimonas kalidii TaxID=3042025 RepID=A0ABT6JTQ3_9GAMM|nr:SMC-Scp complex subunit ScpB [Luteimonas kalidii]MDH5833850.1 SMC-Scp complex subunit ScpB [Luteimonas kalidii]
MDQQLINRIVEAALLASSQPLTVVQLAALFPLDEPAPEGSLQAALQTLQADAAARGVELVEVASGWRYQVQADVHPWVARLWTERQVKYTRATLETLALIAYRQPITRGEIEQVRGVATNSNIIKALEEREWIRVVGHRDMPGRPELLGTTKGFLDYFGLKRLDELPPLSELKDFGELEPQFEFDGERAVGGIATGDGDADADADAGTDGTRAANDPTASGADESDGGSGERGEEVDRRADAAVDPAAGVDVEPQADADADADRDPDTDAQGDAASGSDDGSGGRAALQDVADADTATPASEQDAGAAEPVSAIPGDDVPADQDPAGDASDDASTADDDQSPRPAPPSSHTADRTDAAAEPDALAEDGDSTGVRHE